MIKIEDISVRLGMGSGNTWFGAQKKGALSRVLEPRARAYPAREGCLDQNAGRGNARRRLSGSRFDPMGRARLALRVVARMSQIAFFTRYGDMRDRRPGYRA